MIITLVTDSREYKVTDSQIEKYDSILRKAFRNKFDADAVGVVIVESPSRYICLIDDKTIKTMVQYMRGHDVRGFLNMKETVMLTKDVERYGMKEMMAQPRIPNTAYIASGIIYKLFVSMLNSQFSHPAIAPYANVLESIFTQRFYDTNRETITELYYEITQTRPNVYAANKMIFSLMVAIGKIYVLNIDPEAHEYE